MSRPPKQGPEMCAADAASLANVLRRTEIVAPDERDVTVIARALRRARADSKRSPRSSLVGHLDEALRLATKLPFDRAAFQASVRGAVNVLLKSRVSVSAGSE